PEPVPVVMNQVGVERSRGRWPEPDVEVDFRRRGTDGLFANTLAWLVTEAARDQQFAKSAGFHQFGDMLVPGVAASLSAVLHNAVVLAGRVERHAPLMNLVAARFFNVNILTRLTGPDGDEGMPMVRSRHRYGIEVLVFKCLA